MKSISSFFSSIALGIGFFCLACQPASAAPGWTSFGTIEEVYPTASGVFFIRVSVATNPTTCVNRIWFSHPGTGAGANRVFAAALAAQMSGKPVQLYATDSCDQWGYSDFTSLSVKN